MPKAKTTKPIEPYKEETEAIRQLINKRWPGAMLRGNDPSLAVQKIPCGILSIDYLLGGGFPRNRHIEIYGNPSTGKTYTALRLLANAHKLGFKAAYIDNERTFDPVFAEHVGINLDELYYHRQENANRVVDFMEVLLRSNELDVIVMDSIAALLPQEELKETMEKSSYGMQQAKLMSKAMRRLTAANSKTSIVYINQLRDNVGSMFTPALTSGGRAMSFYAGIRLQMAVIETLKRKEKVVSHTGDHKEQEIPWGHRAQVKIEKSKVGGARTKDKVSFVFDYNEAHIDREEDIIYIGLVTGLVKRNANTWTIEGVDKKIVGRDKFKAFLKEEIEVSNSLESELKELVNG